jgi:hypothetical protein
MPVIFSSLKDKFKGCEEDAVVASFNYDVS